MSAADRRRFEAEASAAGLENFEIWQLDGHGKKVPAANRDVYYPVLQVVPLATNEAALGYDLGSEPLRRTALEEAARTGLTSATDPIELVQEQGGQRGMLICRPVFGGGNPRVLRGFALAVVRMGTLLRSKSPDYSFLPMSLFLLRKDATSEPLTTSWEANNQGETRLSAKRPIFASGKVFSVTTHAGPDFLRLHPVWEGWLAALTGLVLTAALAIVIGVTFRRRRELEQLVVERTAALSESEEKHRFLVEHAAAGIASHEIVLDAAGTPVDYVFLSANPAFETLTGLRAADILGRRATDVLPGIRKTPFIGTYGKVAMTGRPVSFEQHSKTLGRHFSINAYPLGEGRFATFFTDITDRRASEEALCENRTFLNMLLETIPIPVFYKDTEGRYLVFNKAFEAFCGKGRDELVGTSVFDTYPPELAEIYHAKDAELFEKAGVQVYDSQFQDTHGVRHDVIFHKASITDPGGSITGLVGAVLDVTDRKRAERKLADERQRLENVIAGTNAGTSGSGMSRSEKRFSTNSGQKCWVISWTIWPPSA